MKQINRTAFAVGSTIIAGLSSSVAIAADNPFALSELNAGYMNLAEADMKQDGDTKMKDGSCGEGKCGGKINAAEDKMKEGKCGDKKKAASKSTEGKCGEGKCGGSK